MGDPVRGQAHRGRWRALHRGGVASVALLLAGCATVREVGRAAPPEVLEGLNQELKGREAQVGVLRRAAPSATGFEVEPRTVRELQLVPGAAAWVDPGSGAVQRVHLEALAWLWWSVPEGPRLMPALRAGGLGALIGAAAGALLGLVLGIGPSNCLYVEVPPSDFIRSPWQCTTMPSGPAVGLGALVGTAAGALGGALLGAVLGDRQRVELLGWVSPTGPAALP